MLLSFKIMWRNLTPSFRNCQAARMESVGKEPRICISASLARQTIFKLSEVLIFVDGTERSFRVEFVRAGSKKQPRFGTGWGNVYSALRQQGSSLIVVQFVSPGKYLAGSRLSNVWRVAKQSERTFPFPLIAIVLRSNIELELPLQPYAIDRLRSSFKNVLIDVSDASQPGNFRCITHINEYLMHRNAQHVFINWYRKNIKIQNFIAANFNSIVGNNINWLIFLH